MHEMHEPEEWNLKGLTKIEGHASLGIKLKDRQVESLKLKVMENKRFFTRAVVGMEPTSIPALVSRICGTCSVSHLLCCTQAMESIFKVRISDELKTLRKLAMNGTILRDHAMHLYIFCLPDLWKKDSIMEIAEENPEAVEACFEIKAAANALTSFVLGRAVHPMYSAVGGITMAPCIRKKKEVIEKLENCRHHAVEGLKIFSNVKETVKRNTDFVALKNRDYNFIEGYIADAKGMRLKPEGFHGHLHRIVKPYSQGAAFEFDEKDYMVGALARLDLNREALHKNTKKDAAKYLKMFPTRNSFDNILAQAIENLHCVDYSLELLENIDEKTFEKSRPPKINTNVKGTLKGAGVLEAPRGTLYHSYEIKDGKIAKADIVIPTDQNLIKLENDLRHLVNGLLRDGAGKDLILKECEELIRAFDPCMSCASHFLRIKWE